MSEKYRVLSRGVNEPRARVFFEGQGRWFLNCVIRVLIIDYIGYGVGLRPGQQWGCLTYLVWDMHVRTRARTHTCMHHTQHAYPRTLKGF